MKLLIALPGVLLDPFAWVVQNIHLKMNFIKHWAKRNFARMIAILPDLFFTLEQWFPNFFLSAEHCRVF